MERRITMKLITKDDLNALMASAISSERKRSNLNIHEQASDPIQRLFIAAGQESYFRPHRHPGIREFALILQGLFHVLVFDKSGRITDRLCLGPEAAASAFDLPAGVWHTWIPMAETSLFFEVKQGPYNPETTSEFAPWSPAEGSAQVKEFVNRLRQARVGDRME
jgi:cupin fold WbuC family metalloprotein